MTSKATEATLETTEAPEPLTSLLCDSGDLGENCGEECGSYDFDFDLRALRDALRDAERLEESGYHSVLARSQHSQYGTGWMLADNLSLADDDDDWDGYMTVGSEKVKIKEMTDLLATRFAFLSGAHTPDGCPILTFPDSRVQTSFPEYRCLVNYLLHVPALEDSQFGYVIVVDRRLDKWPSIKSLIVHMSNFFPALIRVAFVIKPEGVLQRALELGYKTILDDCHFKVVLCQSVQELHHYLDRSRLTVDLGGTIRYNHLEWLQHRMDIERMRSCASMIANSLEEFSRCLKETELPNDTETTEHILRAQTNERESIQEDFRIAVRRGQGLLKNIRQVEVKPRAEQLSPTRLHNVTSIERMLIQLDETERSFNRFWSRHEHRLRRCLQLRRFEEHFRKLQSSFAGHMLYLEEHRQVGDSSQKADELIGVHERYISNAKDDMVSAGDLKRRGEELMAIEERELEGSLKPKCQELERMEEALNSALLRRLEVLKLSKRMHQQISSANHWCSEGVDLLSNLPYEMSSAAEATTSLQHLESFIKDGSDLELSAFCASNKGATISDLQSLMIMSTTETSTLLHQVAARIEDVRRMCESRQANLRRTVGKESASKPVQAVSPEKYKSFPSDRNGKKKQKTSPKREIEVIRPSGIQDRRVSLPVAHHPAAQSRNRTQLQQGISSPSTSKAGYVIQELLSTEEVYVQELNSVVENYVRSFESPVLQPIIPMVLRGRQREIFGNLEEICDFHAGGFLQDLRNATKQRTNVGGAIGRCFRDRLGDFYLYHLYCQNKPRSEALRQSVGENCLFFSECQKQAGHRLPLGAYLLKPVQRITKYQLLLKELARCTPDCTEERADIELSLEGMLNLLQQLNASMHQAHISGFPGDLSCLGPLVLQGRFSVWTYRKSGERKLKRTGKTQQRHLFLFQRSLLFCKRRVQPSPYLKEYYEFKTDIPTQTMCLTEQVKGNVHRFEIYTEGHHEVLALQPEDTKSKADWIAKLKQLENGPARIRLDRPKSWTSASTTTATSSDTSCRSSRDLSSNPELTDKTIAGDSNNNPPSPQSLPEEAELFYHTSHQSPIGTCPDQENNLLTITCQDSTSVVCPSASDFSSQSQDGVTIVRPCEQKEWLLIQQRETAPNSVITVSAEPAATWVSSSNVKAQ